MITDFIIFTGLFIPIISVKKKEKQPCLKIVQKGWATGMKIYHKPQISKGLIIFSVHKDKKVSH